MKTVAEIHERAAELNNPAHPHHDPTGFAIPVIVQPLPWEEAKRYYRTGSSQRTFEANNPWWMRIAHDQVVGEQADPNDPGKTVPVIDVVLEPDPRSDEEKCLEQMRNYAEFAWQKILGHRAPAAQRAIAKMAAWLWLLERDDLVVECFEEENWKQFGAPILGAICGELRFPIPFSEECTNMRNSRPCQVGCVEGCTTDD